VQPVCCCATDVCLCCAVCCVSRYAEIESSMVFLGLAGLRDPPRPEVAGAIKDCTNAGIRVIVITGKQGRADRVGLGEGRAIVYVWCWLRGAGGGGAG